MHIKKTSVRTEFFYYLSWFSEQRTLDAFTGHTREVLMNRRQENLLWGFCFFKVFNIKYLEPTEYQSVQY